MVPKLNGLGCSLFAPAYVFSLSFARTSIPLPNLGKVALQLDHDAPEREAQSAHRSAVKDDALKHADEKRVEGGTGGKEFLPGEHLLLATSEVREGPASGSGGSAVVGCASHRLKAERVAIGIPLAGVDLGLVQNLGAELVELGLAPDRPGLS